LLVAYAGINNQGDVSDRSRKTGYWLEHFVVNGEGQKLSYIDFKEVDRFDNIKSLGYFGV